MTRTEHLEWAKQRALEYLDRGDLSNAFASLLSDLGKHPETEAMGVLALAGMVSVMADDAPELRRFIEGFR